MPVLRARERELSLWQSAPSWVSCLRCGGLFNGDKDADAICGKCESAIDKLDPARLAERLAPRGEVERTIPEHGLSEPVSQSEHQQERWERANANRGSVAVKCGKSEGVVVGSDGSAIALGCRRRYCHVCTKKAAGKATRRAKLIWQRKFGNDRAVLITLKLPTKRGYETWQTYQERTGLIGSRDYFGSTLPQPGTPEHKPETLYAEVRAWPKAYHRQVRREFYQEDWQKYLTYLISKLTKWAQKIRFGARLTYVSSLEFTKQGTPHIHAVIPQSQALELSGNFHRFKRMVALAWKSLVPDVMLEHGTDVKFAHERQGAPTFGAGIHYVLKYIHKGPKDKSHEPERCYENSKLRRYRTSTKFGQILVGPENRFDWVHPDTGEVSRLDPLEYKRLYGIHRYYKTRKRALPERHSALWDIVELEWMHRVLRYEWRSYDRAAPKDPPAVALWALHSDGTLEALPQKVMI